ncbi:MAG: DUF3494 domain-containing protein [Bauldia sp.]|nr:DUF3494 domain-containing protein [Bauldia sp.]
MPLGTVADFAILAGTTITNTGGTVINGDLGLAPGTATTGFIFSPIPDNGPGVVNGAVHIADGVAVQAKVNLVTAYLNLQGRPTTVDLTGQDLGGQVLTAGVYNFDTSAGLNGTLTLDAEGNPNALFIINIGSTLTTEAASTVALVNGAQAGNVFFRVGSSATLGTTTTFNGNIVALTSITLTTGANIICGAAWAQNGAVTLDTNTITVCPLIPATVGEVLGPELPDNTQAVVDAIDALLEGGTLPDDIAALIAFLSPDELAAVIAQLGGETATGVAPTGTTAMSSFFSTVLNGTGARRGVIVSRTPSGSVGTVTPADDLPPNTVMTMGYAAVEAPPLAYSAFDQVGLVALPDPDRWTIWGTGFGGIDTVQGDDDAGTHDRWSRNVGFAIGVERRLGSVATLGAAVGVTGTQFVLADGFGGGTSRIVQAAVNARVDAGAFYIAAVAGYGWHHVMTDRTITGLGTTNLVAEFNAHSVGGQVEVGYRLGNARTSVTPYASVELQAFFSPAYTEEALTGVDAFALTYDANRTTTLRTEIGARFRHSFALAGGGSLSLHGSVAWAHQQAWGNTMTAAFVDAPDTTFSIEGAQQTGNALLLSAGVELALANHFSIGGSVSASFGQGSRSYGVSATISYRF